MVIDQLHVLSEWGVYRRQGSTGSCDGVQMKEQAV